MGEEKKAGLRLHFDRGVNLEFHGARVTSDVGLLAYRDLDGRLGLTILAEETLSDTRRGKNTQHSMTALLRQAIYSRLAGYDDTNDAERRRVDPAIRHVVGGRAKDRMAASSSATGRFETEIFTPQENLSRPMDLPGFWVVLSCGRKRKKELVLDMEALSVRRMASREVPITADTSSVHAITLLLLQPGR